MLQQLIARIRNGNPALAWTGVFHCGLFLICFGLSFVDHRSVMGVNPWLKPMKFCLSVALYLFTFSILLGLIDGMDKLRRWLGWAISALMLVEISCITIQAARGVPSHYNISTELDAIIFSLMGICIGINAVLDSVVFGLFVLTPSPELTAGVLWGIRFGLIAFIAAAFEGGQMIMNQAHTVGGPDGGPGVPLLNWSTKHGDLRIAHFIGLHGLQILALSGMAVDKILKRDGMRTAVVTAIAAGYGWLMWWQTQMAFAGQPLFR